jgi:HlyD family secretion protein
MQQSHATPIRRFALAVLVAVLGLGGYVLFKQSQAPSAPTGIAQANGRIEVERVDIATKAAGRVAEIRVREGDFVEKGTVVARMDVADLLAQLAAARASSRRSLQGIGKAKAELGSREADLKLHEVAVRRSLQLSRGVLSEAEIDKRTAERDIAKAAVTGAVAGIADAEAARDAAEAQVNLIQVNIDDMTLTAPVAGRVEYRLVQPGEIVAAGGRVVTLLDVSDVFMTVFLPTSEVGRVSLGSEARIVLDAASQYVVPATVSFVAGEAQFTPKYVETRNEREKLMYRVKLKIDPKLLENYRDYVKAGLTGTAFVKVAADAVFPGKLQPRLPEQQGTSPRTSHAQ